LERKRRKKEKREQKRIALEEQESVFSEPITGDTAADDNDNGRAADSANVAQESDNIQQPVSKKSKKKKKTKSQPIEEDVENVS